MILNTDGGDTLVTFGTGDIIISHVKSIGEGEDHHGIRLNWSKKEHKIGDGTPGINVFDGSEDVYPHPAVNMIFYKKESINVLIEKLREVMEIFDKNENSSI